VARQRRERPPRPLFAGSGDGAGGGRGAGSGGSGGGSGKGAGDSGFNFKHSAVVVLASLAAGAVLLNSEAERLASLSASAAVLLLRLLSDQFGFEDEQLQKRAARSSATFASLISSRSADAGTQANQCSAPLSPFAYRWPSADEESRRPPPQLSPGAALAAALPEELQRLAARCERALRPLSRSLEYGFEIDAATGVAALLLGRRMDDPGRAGGIARLVARLPVSGAPALQLRARGALVGLGGPEGVTLELPSITLGSGARLAPAWRGSLLPQLHASWRCDGPGDAAAARLLPRQLRAGRTAAWCIARPAAAAARLGATHERRRGARGAHLPAAATQALRCTVRCAVNDSEGTDLQAVATYKLRLPIASSARPTLRMGEATLGLTLVPLGGGAVPAMAFAKARAADGTTLRVSIGLACSALGAELGVRRPAALFAALVGRPGGGSGSGGSGDDEQEQWVARLQWTDGRLSTAQVVRKLRSL